MRRVELELGRRRHRRITGPAGAILFACMFLPAVKGCSAPVYPIEAPIFLPPYLFGLAFMLAAWAWTVRGLHRAVRVMRAVTFAAIACATVTLLFAPPIGAVELGIGAFVLATLGWSGCSERRVALSALIVGALGTLWFGLWASTEEAMIGVYLATFGSAALVVGACTWLVDLSLHARTFRRA
ncbi:MAG: hypothetical protein JO257_34250 [Deltaproteobacteria bacterium]|nr:hypothetical protein [Deltaproteobacteria bacterium]